MAQRLEKEGRMAEAGRAAVEQAGANGQWDAARSRSVPDEWIGALAGRLKGTEPAFSNFMNMSPSVRRTYAGFYFEAKSESGRERRFGRIADRLHENLKPMQREKTRTIDTSK